MSEYVGVGQFEAFRTTARRLTGQPVVTLPSQTQRTLATQLPSDKLPPLTTAGPSGLGKYTTWLLVGGAAVAAFLIWKKRRRK